MSDPGEPTDARGKFAWWLMRLCYRLVERIDRRAVPKNGSMWSFTFESGRGAVLHRSGIVSFNGHPQIVIDDGPNVGCPLIYLNDWQYERAHTEVQNV